MDKYLIKMPVKLNSIEVTEKKISAKEERVKQTNAAKKQIATNNNKRKNQDTPEMIKDKENAESENPPKRRSSRVTRSMRSMAEDGPASPEKEIPKKLPFIKYSGAIKYFTESQEIAASADEVMQWVEKQINMDVVPMAFDMEWPFSFQTGPGKSSVIQICVDERCCYVYQLSKLNKIPAALAALINHPKVRLHGVNIKADFRKLERDFPEMSAEPLIEKCVDLGVWCNQVCETGGRWSLERLANFIAKKAMDKSKKVRMSKWHVIPLDENQLMYAAIDVYIGQVIYREIEQRETVKLKNEAEFKEQNGDAAFKLVKGLGENFLSKINEVTI
ncbi:Werner Syndrome-like exonuclease [Drosophila grimshawi]|uniref:3'-5' exonuclease n=1 Tax=Drosophila grimshawi TaxID=7222 RepID=WRNXO_DROGR|nr:Werner Syndrome-like exonuclease [Drosophila grimshawi]B4JF25.1 RecName: Full=3'-5' exonuclease; AltName: Full=Werner Syndrome-like exonuclease [Drosophila grimshawi]EDV93306.1 GH19231 [Drosophila grimshawi]